MYDHDLRTWYRDLFLHSPRRKAAPQTRVGTVLAWGAPMPAADLAPLGHETEALKKHERPQATR
jgi:hypothetical protein